jgi:hypothetical protein
VIDSRRGWASVDSSHAEKRRGSKLGYTRRRFDAATADNGTLIFSDVVRAWIDALVRPPGC